jgi:hypothetical protein
LSKPAISETQIKALVVAELQKTKDFAEFDSGSLVIVTSPLDWSVILKATGGRLDETDLAVVRAIGNRLADKFELLR